MQREFRLIAVISIIFFNPPFHREVRHLQVVEIVVKNFSKMGCDQGATTPSYWAGCRTLDWKRGIKIILYLEFMAFFFPDTSELFPRLAGVALHGGTEGELTRIRKHKI